MTQARSIVDPERAVRLLRMMALLVVAGFAISSLIGFVATRQTQAANRRIVEDAVISIEDAAQIVHHLDQKRLLIETHIFEKAEHEMESLEKRISQVDRDLDLAGRAYERLATFPGEHAIWAGLWIEVLALRESVEKV